MASTVVLKAAGLHTSPNQLSLPEGALSEASNVLIRRDGIIEQRRGFKLYGNSFGTPTDRFKQLTTYRNRIIRHMNSTLQYDSDGAGNFQSFSGSFLEADPSLRMKFIESNGNLYFTSSNGIQKLSAKTSNDLSSSTITPAGAVKAIDLQGKVLYSANNTSGFLPQDSAVAYRVLWGYTDANDNFIAGSPSQRELVYYYQLNFMLQDYMRLLSALDSFSNTPLTTARINDKNYVSTVGVQATSSTADLRAQMIALASKLDNDILLADGVASAPLQITSVPTITSGVCTVTFSSGDPSLYISPGSSIYLSGFTPTTGTINGAQTVVTVTSTDLTFNTTATGPVTMSGQTINLNEFRSIAQPPAVAIPPIHLDNLDIQAYFLSILSKMRVLPDTIISAADQLILDTIDATMTANVELTITIPQDIDDRYFYQVYRSAIFTAADNVSISDVVPNDELQLVYEAYPTAAELAAGEIIVTDITPDDFKGANLYTNNSTGEGILQANEIPPFAKDINRYRNVVFYANTRTKHKSLLNLLGVQAMINDYNLGTIPSITIATISGANTYTFVTGLQEISTITTVADVADSLNGKYFLIDSATGAKYYVYLETTTAVDPAIPNRTGLKVKINTGDSANNVAIAIRDRLSVQLSDFTTSSLANVVTVTNVAFGSVADIVDGDTGFAFAVTQQGRGENIANKQVLLSTNASPAIAVDETARSLIRNINQNSNETIYGYYLSGAFDVPGKMVLEARSLETTAEFFILANNRNTGMSFNPAIDPEVSISSITTGANPVITTSAPHGLLNLDFAVIGDTNSTPSIDGIYEITYISPTQFSISAPAPVTVAGTRGALISSVNAVTSENEVKLNRVYYSKLYQPEAVPATNYFNVGAEDKAILRIFPLRDSLFVFKEDGLYRISGDSAPFQLNLFDSSFNVTAPDSVTVINNVIFGWTTQGIQSLTEGGAQVVSRAIDNQILKLGSVNYTNFKTATWGVGYESDNSYLVFTVSDFGDEIATKAFRFSTLTQSWTTYDKTNTCGVINSFDDKLYLGAGDTNYIEQERKLFDRTDYADRELSATLDNNFLINPTVVKLNSVTGYSVGDVVVQTQTVTAFEFNTLLKKLDGDAQINDNTFLSTLELVTGDNPRFRLLELAQKLDANPSIVATTFESSIDDYNGTITAISGANPTIITSAGHNLITGRIVEITGSNSTPSINGTYPVTVIDANTFSIPVSVKIPGTTGFWQTDGQDFQDIRVCYNKVITMLNADTGVSFSNYKQNNTETIQEAIITEISVIKKQLTLNIALQYLVGDITVYKAIKSLVKYSPITMGDPLGLKHLRESTLMLETRNITNATLSFGSDLLPELIPIKFSLDGNGIFGHNSFGDGFFGGASNSAPFRTFIPRQSQRCRFIVVQYEHGVAREDYRLLGITITGETGLSTRSYR